MLYVINYANGNLYESRRKINTKTAYSYGRADRVLEFCDSDIPQSYRDEHANVFAYKRGAGLWLWKPYIILDTLTKMSNDDWLFYCDSGTYIIDDIHELIATAEKNNDSIMLFELPLLNRAYCKKEAYTKIGLYENGENQVLGTYLLIKKDETSMSFVKEWQRMCEDIVMLSPEHYTEEKEYDDYISHREDQSILSLLAIKNGIKPYRDCSDYGEMPFMYCNDVNYKVYNPHKYDNSPFPTILLCNRREDPIKYMVKYYVKRVLCRCGVYTKRR